MKLICLFLFLLTSTNLSLAVELPLPDKPHIIIEGYGFVEQVPDIIMVDFDVSATDKNLSLAKKDVDHRVSKAIQAARELGIKKDKINASKIQAHPRYEWSTNTRQYLGENVSRQVRVTLTNPDHYNALVDALLAAGITRLQNVQMDFSQRQSLENQAMKRALDDARQQAKSIANNLDNKLGNVFQIARVGTPMVAGRLEMIASDSASNKASGLEPGKQIIEQRVRVVYLLAH